jgi:hypothetical protein
LVLVLFVNDRFKTKIQFNGCEYASAEEMPVRVRVAYERAIHETPALHSGARLAAKLKATIIVDDTQFNHAGEMSVDDRQLYHEALEALFPPDIAVSVGEAHKTKRNRLPLIVLGIGVLVGAAYLLLHVFFS